MLLIFQQFKYVLYKSEANQTKKNTLKYLHICWGGGVSPAGGGALAS